MLHTLLSILFLVSASTLFSRGRSQLHVSAFPLVPRATATEDTLFPYSRGLSSWTTRPGAPGCLPLSDNTFRPTNVSKGPSHQYMPAPDGHPSLRAYFPQGSYKPTAEPRGGFSFYAAGPVDVDLTTAKEATLGYAVYFPDGFDWVKGGKLPGLYGGDTEEGSKSCSGGRINSTCFSARYMWRTNGAGELYTYLPPYTDPRFQANNKTCASPNSICNLEYGTSIGRGNFTFQTSQWTTITERVKLNDEGQANGELEVIADGKPVISLDGLIIRDNSDGRIRGLQMQTFFGGSTSDWATPKNQTVFFSDFSVAVLTTLDGRTKKSGPILT